MLARTLDSLLHVEEAPEVRRNVVTLTAARLFANACYRFAPPFLALIARGVGVSLQDIGVALAIAETAGLLSPLTARLVDRLSRRTAMVAGLLGVAAGTTLAASSTGLVLFTVALVTLSQSKVLFDLGLGTWISDHVPYERRSRVVGLTETSWALGLLIGVSAMGLATAVTSWRVGYLVGAGAVLVMAGIVAAQLRADPGPAAGSARQPPATATEPTVAAAGLAGPAPAPAPTSRRERRARASRVVVAPTARIGLRGWLVVLGACTLMMSSQCLFVTFGAWLEDGFGFTPATISAVVFGLGLGELLASLMSARNTDRWGKETSAARGAMLMVPAGAVLAVWDGTLGIGLVALALAIAGFEFGIVSSLAAGTALVPASPARGLGMLIAGGTVGRAIASIPATRLYEQHGMTWPALLSAALATFSAAALLSAHHLRRTTV